MQTWVTVVSRSPFAVINPLWAACTHEKYMPERIYLLKNKIVEEEGNVEKVRDFMSRIIMEFGGREPEIKEVDSEETDFKNFAGTIGEIVKKEKNLGNEVAVDMTPGRKFMSALVMYLGLGEGVKEKADRVYYLYLTDYAYENQPYMKIPLPKQRLFEMKKYLLREKS